jgi:hypothetical protein
MSAQAYPPTIDGIPHGFTEEDGVHEKSWQEKYRADEKTLEARGHTSDFCGAWIAFWSHIAREHGAALEAESARIRARKGVPGESCERILEKARGAYMAVMGAAVRSDKQRTRLRRFKASALYLEATRRGVSYDFESMPPEEKRALVSNLRRYWREAWTYISLVQRVIGLPLVERERRSFKASAGKPEAAHYTDRLSDLIGGIIAEKDKARGGNRLQRFERAVAVRLANFRHECEHMCRDRKDADGKECQRPHLITPPKGDTDPEPDDKPKGTSSPRAKVLPFSKAAEKLTDGVQIILDRAARGLLTAEEAEQAVMMFAPVVALIAGAEGTQNPRMEDGVPYADLATETVADEFAPNAEFVQRASDEKSDFPAENAQVEEVNADKFIRIDAPPPDPEKVTPDDFLSAFYPDSGEEIRLRFLAPKGIPTDKKGYPLESRFSTKKEGITRAALQSDARLRRKLAWLNETRGAYFIPNAGGDCDKDITRINAFFAESDKGTLEEQHAKFDACPVPPSARLETKKSVHGYWFAAPGQPVEKFRPVQIGLIQYFGSDEQIKNEARVMRLPFTNHVAYNAGLLDFKPVKVTHFDSSRRLTAAEMLAAFPAASEAKPKPQRPPKTIIKLTGDFEDYKREIGARISTHATARLNGRGNWDCRAVCHNGKGATGLFYDPSQNFVWCNAELSCDLDTIALAFGITRAKGAVA